MRSLIGPAVVAAVVSAIVSIVGFYVNRATNLKIHKEKLSADIELAERKFLLDRKLGDWRRRAEIAEQVLADFYTARDIFSEARQPFSFGHEGTTRPDRLHEETEEQARLKDAIYTPWERLSTERVFFFEMQARRYRFVALFGPEAEEPFTVINRSYNEIYRATGHLLDKRVQSAPVARGRYEAVIGWGTSDTDQFKDRLDVAVEQIEKLCVPILRRIPK